MHSHTTVFLKGLRAGTLALAWFSCLHFSILLAQDSGAPLPPPPPPIEIMEDSTVPLPPPPDPARDGEQDAQAKERHLRRAVEAGPFDPDKLPPHIRRRYDNASEQDKERIRRNFTRFQQMPPPDRESMKEGINKMRDAIHGEVEAALKKSGISLTEEQKQRFTRRYAEERRTLERELRTEMDQRRAAALPGLVERVKVEVLAPEVPAGPTGRVKPPSESDSSKPMDAGSGNN